MQHSEIEIVKGRPYVVFVRACKYEEEEGWTWFDVSPPLDEDRDGAQGETIIINGNTPREPGLMIVQWNGEETDEGYRFWEEAVGEGVVSCSTDQEGQEDSLLGGQ